MPRVLLFGATGWIGQAVIPALRSAGHDVIAPRHEACDISDAAEVRGLFGESKPDAVSNCAAANTPVKDEALLRAVNVNGAQNVAAAAANAKARLVHVSTDLVLDGRSPPYRDDAPANPVTAYGRSKAA